VCRSDLNATIDRLRAGVSGSRFETVDFRSDGGGGAVTTSSQDVGKTSPGGRGGDVDDDDDEDDIAAALERAQLNDRDPAVSHHAWDDMAESSPC